MNKNLIQFILLTSVAVFCFYIASPVENPWGDMALTIPTSRSLIRDGDILLNEFESSALLDHYGSLETSKGVVNYFPWGGALVASPIVLVNDIISITGLTTNSYTQIMNAGVENAELWGFEKVIGSLFSSLAVLVIGLISLEWAREKSSHQRAKVMSMTMLLYGFGTSLWSVTSRSVWQHGPSIFLNLLAIFLALRLRVTDKPGRLVFALGLVVGLAYTVRPTNLIVLVVFCFWVLLKRRGLFISFCGGSFTILTIWASFNIRSGMGIIPPYYRSSRAGLHSEFVEALAGNLLSPSRGLIIFSPFLFVAFCWTVSLYLFRSKPSVNNSSFVFLSGVIFLGIWVASSAFPHWWGGHSFGPRLMSESLPFTVVPFLVFTDHVLPDSPDVRGGDGTSRDRCSHRKKLFVGALAVSAVASVGVHAQGALMSEAMCWNRVPDDVDQNPDRLWSLTDPQFLVGVKSLVGASGSQVRSDDCFSGW